MGKTKLDWDDLRLFLAIARAGTLTGAAPFLRLSQPTAGRRLRALEAACGCALFQRGAAGLRLTDEGEAMLLHAERIEEEALAIARRFAGSQQALQGQLRLSASEWFSRLVLAPPIAAFLDSTSDGYHRTGSAIRASSICIAVRRTSSSGCRASTNPKSSSASSLTFDTGCSPPPSILNAKAR